jgi:nucleotide-binding universal stress UspA family protein
MRSLSKILLPVDFSERSVRAARCARSLACHFHSELTLLHVVTPLSNEYGAIESGGTLVTELFQNRVAQISQELDSFLVEELAGIDAKRLVIEGDIAPSIVNYAHENGFGLIMMPTHGYGPFRRFILGSNTAKVLHDADCPVWTGVHIEEAPVPPEAGFRNILCAIDLGPQSVPALKWAAELQQDFGARLTVVHASSPCPEAADGSTAAWVADMREAAENELLELQSELGIKADVFIECGDPAKVICSAALRVQADVAVIGRGSAAGVFGRLRANAYSIIRQSPCPVVSV